MIRFIDIANNNVFNGDKPYVFWMDKEQSVNVIYTKTICILSDQETINISIPSNDIFKLLDMSRLNSLTDLHINGFDYKNIQQLYANEITSIGVETDLSSETYPAMYVHMLYITGQSSEIGEFHENFIIDDNEYEIAADFYAENEALKINLANFGVEIPESIQTSIYDTNVHEEVKDNILLNRKYKELLLNYWSIVAGKGSYKSLIDSLNWFEYGDLVKLEEIWKHDEWNQTRLDREELNKIMTNDVRLSLSNFIKTTYIGIYLALQEFVKQNGVIQYDKLDNITLTNDQSTEIMEGIGVSSDYSGLLGEMTPKLKNKLFKWSVEEMSMKMYLLGAFYETYFMPIHLDLLHSTIEDIVFTNTIKCMYSSSIDRVDHVYNLEAFECSIKDGDSYTLHDVNVQAGSMLKRHWDDSDDSDDYETLLSNTYGNTYKENIDGYVDLGLPSGLLWATSNLGATCGDTNETWYGNYFSWGETETKSNYSWQTYKYSNGTNASLTKYNFDSSFGIVDNKYMLDPTDDAANVKLGRGWKIPTVDDFTELRNSTTSEYVTNYNNIQGLNGRVFTSVYNGNKLFIPSTGMYDGENLSIRERSRLWSCNLNDAPNKPDYAKILNIHPEHVTITTGYRCYGCTIRPVISSADTRNSDDGDEYDQYPVFGVEDEYNHPMQLTNESSDDTIVNNRLKTFMINNYNGIGVVIPVQCKIPAEKGDFINYEKILVSSPGYMKEIVKNFLYSETDNFFNINFNLLLTDEGVNNITLYFSTAGGRSYIKTVHLNIVGDMSCKLKLYKVKSCSALTGLNEEDYSLDKVYDVDKKTGKFRAYQPEFKREHVRIFNDYQFTHVRDNINIENYRLFVPSVISNVNDNGVRLNSIIIFDADFFNCGDEDKINRVKNYIGDNFDIGVKYVTDSQGDPTNVVKYYILVAKPFYLGFVGESEGGMSYVEHLHEELNGYILRYDVGYFFQHHYLEEIGLGYNESTDKYEYGLSLNDYTITDEDTLCVIPEMKYSTIKLTDIEWIFKNTSTKEKEEYKFTSIKEPFIGNNVKKQLKPGYYNIIFNYKIGNTLNQVILDSAFRKI